MSNFAHEIKTPMTAILGFADTLRTYDCDVDTGKNVRIIFIQRASVWKNCPIP